MKILAEYVNEDGMCYRKNTLLQFGSSWDLIGSAVLANPGSAKPIGKPSEETLNQILKFFGIYRDGESLSQRNWREFTPDSTMMQVEKIFNGWYVGSEHILNGVIQLFNVFNVIDQHLDEAITKISYDSENSFSHGFFRFFHDRPTYFGFSQRVLANEKLRKHAEEIFNKSSEIVRRPYKGVFSENLFYHPGYVNRAFGKEHFKGYKAEVLSRIFSESIRGTERR